MALDFIPEIDLDVILYIRFLPPPLQNVIR